MSKENLAVTGTTGHELVAQPTATIDLPVLTNQAEVMETLGENMETLGDSFRMQFDRVKIPSGGGISFEIIGEDGTPEPVKEIQGVVIDGHPCNACWKEVGTANSNPPDCSSVDGKTGTGSEVLGIESGQACATCPYNQWGSDPRGGRGKHCKNMVRLAALPKGYVFPVIISLPPTSISNWANYIQRLMNRGTRTYYGVVTSIKLQRAQNKEGTDYSEVVFAKAADLTPAESKAIKAYAAQLRPAIRGIAIDAIDYNVEPAQTVTYSDDPEEEEGY